MKKTALVILAFSLVAMAAMSEDFDVNSWDSHFKAGDTSLGIGAGLGLGSWFSVAVYPEFEQVISDFKIGDTMPLAIGVAAKGMASIYIGGYSGIVVGGGAFVPIHLGLKGLDLDFMQNLDFYVAPGIAISFDTGALGWTNPLGIGFGEYTGINYFVDDNTAVYLEEMYWGYYWGGSVGLRLKL